MATAAAAAAAAAAAVSSPAAPRAAATARRGFVTFGGGASRSSPALRPGRGLSGEGPFHDPALISAGYSGGKRFSILVLRWSSEIQLV